MIADGCWGLRWGGHLKLHIVGNPLRMAWSDLMLLLGGVDLALLAAALAAMIGIRRASVRAALCAGLLLPAWWLQQPIAYVGNQAVWDAPESVDVHFACRHPIAGASPDWLVVDVSWHGGG